jgi:hypothetical protein
VVYFEVEDQMRLVGNEPQAYFMVNEDGTVEKAPAPTGFNFSPVW